MRAALWSTLLLAVVGGSSAAQEMKPPRLLFATIDWAAAVATLAEVDALRPAPKGALAWPVHADGRRDIPPALVRLNAVMSQRFAGLVTSPVPVLLPFDAAALLRDQAAGTATPGNERYSSGFHAAKFFYPGPAGYDAAFAIRASDVPELSDIKFSEPIRVQISGSALLYQLDWPITTNGLPVPALDNELPGIQRLILEHHVRYTFVRFGVPYVVSIGCFDAGVSRYKMPTCRTADQVALHFLRALRFVGGVPHHLRAQGRFPSSDPPRCRPPSSTTDQARSCPAPDSVARAAAPTIPSIRRFAFRSPTRRPTPARRCFAASMRAVRTPTFPTATFAPGATISASAAVSRSANALPVSGTRVRISVRRRARRLPAWSIASGMTTSLPCAAA